MILFFTWTTLILNSFENFSLKFKLNSISLLHILNSNLNHTRVINYLYFLQNDVIFSTEYLNLVESYDFSKLEIEEINQKEDNELLRVNAFLESVLFDTNRVIFQSIGIKQLNLLGVNEPNYVTNKQEMLKNNLFTLVRIVKCILSKSNNLFELSLKLLTDLVASCSDNTENYLNFPIVELFKCFDLNRSSQIIKHFFYEESLAKSNGVKDEAIKQLLLNLIYLLKWPLNNTINEWICTLMSILAIQAKKFQLLIQICEETSDYVSFMSILKLLKF